MTNEVNLEKVCQPIFGMSPRRYRQLASENIVPPVVNGKIDFLIATRELLAYQRKLLSGQGSVTLADERTRLTKINADRKQLMLERERGELVETEKEAYLWGNILMIMRQRLLAMPVKLSPLVYGCRDINEISSIIKKFVYEILNELKKGNAYIDAIVRRTNGKKIK